MGMVAGHGIVYDIAFDGASGGHDSERSDTYHVEGVSFLPAEVGGMAMYFFRVLGS